MRLVQIDRCAGAQGIVVNQAGGQLLGMWATRAMPLALQKKRGRPCNEHGAQQSCSTAWCWHRAFTAAGGVGV